MDSKKVIYLESEEDGTIENLTKSNKGVDGQFRDNNQFEEDDNETSDDENNENNNNENNNNENNNNENNNNENNNNENNNNENNNNETSDYENNNNETSDYENNNNDVQDGGNESESDESVATDDILAVDPMYVRLTKFLETNVKLESGGTQTKNITEILYELSDTFKKFNQTFTKVEKYMENLSTKQ